MIRLRRIPLLLCVVLLAHCQTSPVQLPVIGSPRMSDEQQITLLLDDVQRGMEQRRIYKVLAHVSRNYRDKSGRDYQAIQAYLNSIFDRYRNIRITRTQPRVWVQGNRAEALEAFGTSAEAIHPAEDLDIHLQGQVTVYLERIDGVWKIVEWGPIQ